MTDKRLSKEQADLVLKKNQENIIKKAAAGKVLTKHELEVLHEITGQAPKKKRLTLDELAEALSIGRRTITHLRKTHGAPRSANLLEWQNYLIQRATETGDEKTADRLPGEIQKFRAKLLRAQAGKEEAVRNLRELELRQKSDNLVPMAEAKDAIKRVLAPLAGLLESMPKAVALQGNPTDPLLAEEAVRGGLEKVFEMLKDGVEE